MQALPSEMQERCRNISILLDDMPAALPVLETLWNVDEAEARRISRRFVDRSLAQKDTQANGESGIHLHNLQSEYVRATYGRPEALAPIRGAVRLSYHVIAKSAQEFASQSVGRLLPYRDTPELDRFIGNIVAGAPVPWLRPLRPALHPPGTALLRILEGHTRWVTGVAVSPDGRRAVSASYDNTLKVWDLESGLLIATFHCDAAAQCCTFAGQNKIVAGDAGGQLHFLAPEEQRKSHELS